MRDLRLHRPRIAGANLSGMRIGSLHAGSNRHRRKTSAGTLCAIDRLDTILALAVLMPLSFLWFGFVMPKLPQMRTSDNLVTLSQPSSKAYQTITVHAVSRANVFPTDPDPPPSDVRVKLTDATGMPHELVIDSATLHFRDASSPPGAMSTSPLDADALVAWLHAFRRPGTGTKWKGRWQ